MCNVLLDAATLGADVDLSPLEACGTWQIYPTTAPDQVAQRIAGARCVVTNKVVLGEQVLSQAPQLRLICVAATGYDPIDTAYCRRAGIALCNVPGYSTPSVTQVTLAMALELMTHLGQYRQYVASGAYSQSGVANCLSPAYHEIAGKTWGVVGGGGIARGVARAAQALGARVLMCRQQPEKEFPSADMDTLCRQSQILSLHVPLTDATRGMLSRERIFSLPKGAVVINTARGAVADEQALADALSQGHLGGLGVDVFSTEPFGPDHPFYPLLQHPNLCLTPHMAWGSVESRRRCMAEVAQNILCFFAGKHRNRVV